MMYRQMFDEARARRALEEKERIKAGASAGAAIAGGGGGEGELWETEPTLSSAHKTKEATKYYLVISLFLFLLD